MNKNILRDAGFGKEVENVERGLCPICTNEIDHNLFKDALSRKEFAISGLCQNCQDEVFKEEEEEI